ncbi:hypothetical protein BDV29DRAFT_171347 [Aspergillus leporis]|uniref:NAD(P)-binding protein n=1 Tax=Aspergillus leporis TaxID=41062 RepID=A0A5N5X6X1_9EURO|nr:hypothetical protein BDV29DRAFT_171347 [Aspergillus leporis]
MTISTDNKVYVVTGANRGIGLGLVKSLLTRTNTTILATVRNTEAATSLKSDSAAITPGSASTLHIIELDFTTAISPEKIRQAIPTTIPHIDVLIANAGWATSMKTATETTAEDLRTSFEINTIAPLLTFQAFWPLLQKSSTPKFIAITSSVGSIADQEPVPGGAYGPSKAALNWLTMALHVQNEEEGLVAVALHPGWVKTRSGDFAVKEWNYPDEPPVTVEDSVAGILKVTDEATRETSSGKFVTFGGDELRW